MTLWRLRRHGGMGVKVLGQDRHCFLPDALALWLKPRYLSLPKGTVVPRGLSGSKRSLGIFGAVPATELFYVGELHDPHAPKTTPLQGRLTPICEHPPIMATTIYPSHHPQPSSTELDYSTPANPNDTTNETLNLSVLQRHLPSTLSIAFLAPYAVVYVISSNTQTWEKSGIEGTLFVVKLQNGEHAVVVLNRRGLDNFIQFLKNKEDVDVTEDYIILRGNGADSLGNGSEDEQKVYGLWIFEEELGSTKGVRGACGRCIVECAEMAGKEPGIGTGDGQSNGLAQQQQSAGASNGPDLMALLNPSRAQRST